MQVTGLKNLVTYPKDVAEPSRFSTADATDKQQHRHDLVTISTTGVDLVGVNMAPARDMTVSERRKGWGQIGATVAVKTLNTALALGGGLSLGLLGSAFLGPVGAVAGAITGLAGGIAVGAWGEGFNIEKPTKALKNLAAKAGARVAEALSGPLQAVFPKAVKEYQLGPAASRLRISEQDLRDFKANLKPGDVLLTLNDNDPIFHSIVALQKKPLDFTHVMLYAGEDKVIEASSRAGKVRYQDLDPTLENKAQVVAIRPDYKDGQAQKVVEQAATYIGRAYDWAASMNDKRLGCVEVPYHAFKVAAPEYQVSVTKVWGVRDFIFPADYLNLSHSKVVASAGVARPVSRMPMARYAWVGEK